MAPLLPLAPLLRSAARFLAVTTLELGGVSVDSPGTAAQDFQAALQAMPRLSSLSLGHWHGADSFLRKDIYEALPAVAGSLTELSVGGFENFWCSFVEAALGATLQSLTRLATFSTYCSSGFHIINCSGITQQLNRSAIR